jgi:hypothetical protein
VARLHLSTPCKRGFSARFQVMWGHTPRVHTASGSGVHAWRCWPANPVRPPARRPSHTACGGGDAGCLLVTPGPGALALQAGSVLWLDERDT